MQTEQFGHVIRRARRWLPCAAGVLAVLVGMTAALDVAAVAAAADAKTPAKQLAKLKADYAADYESTKKTVKDPKTGQVIEVQLVGTVPADKYVPALLELGKSDDEATAAAALSMAIVNWADDPRAAGA